MRILDDLLREAKEAGASDVHISQGRPPFFRIDGQLQAVGQELLSPEEATSMIDALLKRDPEQRSRELQEDKQTDFSYALQDGTRFRVNVFQHVGAFTAALR